MNGATPGHPQTRYNGALRWVSEAVLAAFYQVYRELGPGFLECVYEAAVAIVLGGMGLRVEWQVPVIVRFRGAAIGSFRIDLLVESAIAVELKASRTLDPAHEAQLLNYLRASDLEVGLLLNFGQRPSFKRLAYSNDRKGRRRCGGRPLDGEKGTARAQIAADERRPRAARADAEADTGLAGSEPPAR
jgi:GxxExxY protein